MELQITGTNMEITPAAQRYIKAKFTKLTKHLPDIIDIKVEVSEEGTKSPQQRYLMRAAVNGGVGGAIFHGEERAENLLQATDRTAEALTRQLEKRKGKLYDRGRGNPNVRGKFKQPGRRKKSRKSLKSRVLISARCPRKKLSKRWNVSAMISFSLPMTSPMIYSCFIAVKTVTMV